MTDFNGRTIPWQFSTQRFWTCSSSLINEKKLSSPGENFSLFPTCARCDLVEECCSIFFVFLSLSSPSSFTNILTKGLWVGVGRVRGGRDFCTLFVKFRSHRWRNRSPKGCYYFHLKRFSRKDLGRLNVGPRPQGSFHSLIIFVIIGGFFKYSRQRSNVKETGS